jgi:hypothetical protein
LNNNKQKLPNVQKEQKPKKENPPLINKKVGKDSKDIKKQAVTFKVEMRDKEEFPDHKTFEKIQSRVAVSQNTGLTHSYPLPLPYNSDYNVNMATLSSKHRNVGYKLEYLPDNFKSDILYKLSNDISLNPHNDPAIFRRSYEAENYLMIYNYVSYTQMAAIICVGSSIRFVAYGFKGVALIPSLDLQDAERCYSRLMIEQTVDSVHSSENVEYSTLTMGEYLLDIMVELTKSSPKSIREIFGTTAVHFNFTDSFYYISPDEFKIWERFCIQLILQSDHPDNSKYNIQDPTSIIYNKAGFIIGAGAMHVFPSYEKPGNVDVLRWGDNFGTVTHGNGHVVMSVLGNDQNYVHANRYSPLFYQKSMYVGPFELIVKSRVSFGGSHYVRFIVLFNPSKSAAYKSIIKMRYDYGETLQSPNIKTEFLSINSLDKAAIDILHKEAQLDEELKLKEETMRIENEKLILAQETFDKISVVNSIKPEFIDNSLNYVKSSTDQSVFYHAEGKKITAVKKCKNSISAVVFRQELEWKMATFDKHLLSRSDFDVNIPMAEYTKIVRTFMSAEIINFKVLNDALKLVYCITNCIGDEAVGILASALYEALNATARLNHLVQTKMTQWINQHKSGKTFLAVSFFDRCIVYCSDLLRAVLGDDLKLFESLVAVISK